MKKIALILILILFLFGCSKKEKQHDNLFIDYQKVITVMCDSKANYYDTIKEYPDYYYREFNGGHILLIYYVSDKVVLLMFDENGERVFAEIAHKYGGELPVRFDWGYALAWHEGDEIKVVSALATTGTERTKIVDKISDKKVPGFCFAPILKVLIDGEWKYDSELSDEDSWKAYWNIQAETIKSLLDQCLL